MRFRRSVCFWGLWAIWRRFWRFRFSDSVLVTANHILLLSDAAFPGCVAGVSGKSTLWSEAFGDLRYNTPQQEVTMDTLYDLASLTKVVSTTSAAMWLWERGMLQLDDPVYQTIPEFAAGGKEDAQNTLR